MPSLSQSHSYKSMVPSGSWEAEASNVTFSPTFGFLGDQVKFAVGASAPGALTVIGFSRLSVAPSLSVTLNVTRYSLGAPHEWVGVGPVSVVPSPKSHSYFVIVPSGSYELLASNATVSSTSGLDGLHEKSAVGGEFRTVIVFEAVSVLSFSSVIVNVTV